MRESNRKAPGGMSVSELASWPAGAPQTPGRAGTASNLRADRGPFPTIQWTAPLFYFYRPWTYLYLTLTVYPEVRLLPHT